MKSGEIIYVKENGEILYQKNFIEPIVAMNDFKNIFSTPLSSASSVSTPSPNHMHGNASIKQSAFHATKPN